jgi:outer membrane protein OmpA-like peptidoglycan-associated protein
MRRAAGTAMSAAMLLALGVVISTGCVSRPPERVASAAPPRPAQSPLPHRLAQLHFGREARFALCAGHACPMVTPKTLAAAEAPRAELPPGPPPQSASPTPAVIAADPSPTANPAATAGAQKAVASAPALDEQPRRQQVVVHFPFGKATLSEAGQATLRSTITLARASDRIVIHGRTDATGSDEVNEALAFARALAVRDYIRMQIPDLPNVIAISARGNCCFVASNDSAEGRLRNRRVEIVFELRGEVRA